MTAYQEKKNAILRKAADVFSKKGYYGTGLQEILSACDIPKGSFYHYFPNGKEELAVEVVYFAYESMAHGIQTRLFPVSDNATAVFTGMLQYLQEHVLAEDHLMSSLLMTFFGIESVYISPRMSAACGDVYKKWQKMYEGKLVECGYCSEMAAKLSLTIFTLVHGAMISSWIKQDTGDLAAMQQVLPLILPEPDKQ